MKKNEKKDYYNILETTKEASKEEIKKSYRRMALKYHPDTSKEPNATEKFKEINEAYEVLSDDSKRSQYDQYGTVNMGASGFRDPRDIFSNFGGGSDDDEFQNFVREHLFGQRGSSQKREPRFSQRPINPDIKIGCNIHIKDAIKGGDIELAIKRNIACDKCKTVGVENFSETCPICKGEGSKTGMVNGNMFIRQTCNACQGTGRKIVPCPSCKGEGYSQVEENLSIKIPNGVLNGATLRCKDKGHVIYNNNDKIIGSVYIVVNYPEIEDNVNVMDGDIYANITIPIDLALTNDKIKVNILGVKKLELELNPRTHSGHEYIVDGGGINSNKNAYIKVFFDLPKKDITEEQRNQLISLLKEIYGESPVNFKPLRI